MNSTKLQSTRWTQTQNQQWTKKENKKQFLYNNIQKNQMPWNKLNQVGERLVHWKI